MTEALHRQVKVDQSTAQAKCVHHWLIAPPEGSESLGVCMRCGAKRRFANVTESARWERSDAPRTSIGRTVPAHVAERDTVLAEEA